MSHPLVYTFAACLAAVALEGLCAGRGIKRRLAELRFPSFAPPLWAWVAIGGAYYGACFLVLYRLCSLSATVPLRNLCLALLAGVMLVNALWNLFFFRTRNLVHAFLVGLPYSALAVTLFVVLLRVDRTAAWGFSPYVPYLLVYANLWGYRVWQLNRPSAKSPATGGQAEAVAACSSSEDHTQIPRSLE
jgi:tryptophan-rich sensory protein